MEQYLKPLIEGTTLNVFNDNELIFKSSSNWLYPLFEFESFLLNSSKKYNNLSAHDTAGGKAAAALMIKFNIKKVNFNLLSESAKALFEDYKVLTTYTVLVDKLQCKTEEILENDNEIDRIYSKIKIKAKETQGLSISIKNLTIGYNNKAIYTFNNFHIEGGDTLLIEGDNGIGKTTFIKTLLQEIAPIEGNILINNEPINKLPPKTIGYIKQEKENQDFPISVKEVVSMGISNKLSKTEKNYLLDTSLRKCKAINLINRNYYSLSGGEKQKVSLARCLCQKAKILILDEPTSFLDKESKIQLITLLKSLSISEMPTILLITHDKELREQLNWNIYKMEKKNA
ncbi:MAG: DUF1893 domain-containing protein [Sphaerochaetaceae bacterium]|nr:DUF1893 domain-containing protein [Sphaerochaetaceae bacterium]